MTQEESGVRDVYRGDNQPNESGGTLDWKVWACIEYRHDDGTEDGDWREAKRRELDPAPSQAIWNHSPDGFSWGYGGSGPHQLAIGLLLEAGATDQEAKWEFKRRLVIDLVAPWPQDGTWMITRDELRQRLAAYRADVTGLELSCVEGGI